MGCAVNVQGSKRMWAEKCNHCYQIGACLSGGQACRWADGAGCDYVARRTAEGLQVGLTASELAANAATGVLLQVTLFCAVAELTWVSPAHQSAGRQTRAGQGQGSHYSPTSDAVQTTSESGAKFRRPLGFSVRATRVVACSVLAHSGVGHGSMGCSSLQCMRAASISMNHCCSMAVNRGHRCSTRGLEGKLHKGLKPCREATGLCPADWLPHLGGYINQA